MDNIIVSKYNTFYYDVFLNKEYNSDEIREKFKKLLSECLILHNNLNENNIPKHKDKVSFYAYMKSETLKMFIYFPSLFDMAKLVLYNE